MRSPAPYDPLRSLIVTYDIVGQDRDDKRRLRQVARLCERYGQRVQYSVFECRVTDGQWEELYAGLQALINKQEDSIRIYHIPGERAARVQSLGRDTYRDFEHPLVI